jgi:hypothetical protein
MSLVSEFTDFDRLFTDSIDYVRLSRPTFY